VQAEDVAVSSKLRWYYSRELGIGSWEYVMGIGNWVLGVGAESGIGNGNWELGKKGDQELGIRNKT
jgi:hypothetical protein